MKRVIIAAIVLIAILGLGIAEQIYIRSTMEEMSDALDKLEQALITGGDGTAENEYVKEVWDKKHRLLETITPHNETKEIYVKISEIDGFISVGDTENALAVVITLSDIISYTEHLLFYLPEHVL